MHLYDIPLIFILAGLVFYIVLGGADFGAGIWQLTAGAGPEADRLRHRAHQAVAPVWEANHVWLVFVITVMWTAYPSAFGSLASTLELPLFAAAIGIILRGATYALRTGARSDRETHVVDTVFAASSLMTPFALGAAIGAIAAGRVPVGNAAGRLFHSWTGSVSILVGLLSVAFSAYMAAVFLCADSTRVGELDLAERFRARALIAAVVAGGLAIGGLIVLHSGAHRIYHRLLDGPGLPALIVSVLAGGLTLGLVIARRFSPARYTAAVAVAAIVAGWGLAQHPVLLHGLTVGQAAAPHDTLVLVIVAVVGGGAILFPSMALLFRLVLGGRFDAPGQTTAAPAAAPGAALFAVLGPRLLIRGAGAALVAGFGLLTVADAGWAHAIGVVCLLAFVVLGVGAVAPTELAE
jgi:cytochrome bd ubiquinol oxidase subunit II